MGLLFGTVEYFESELTSGKQTGNEVPSQIYLNLEKEIRFDFICDEQLRSQCLQNLTIAYKKLTDSRLAV
ncbi:hypothetical protein SM124_10090 [Bacillus sp. 31A1R]|uniref:Uncharacterized protein n=1 Tax=Robertmurraya mangrovi TaxID=3098077 RepID=A0ABU5IY71_9BACI|nr:hypothetical protein [Bacillus sp. 31A1R]MDZ5472097.1 hypothetical protein [Bacillus sp. 31A1R]